MSMPDSIVSQPPLRILSLDGGGYRGLASLEILDRLMRELKRDDGTIPKPCEVFDFIIGTSTGGLIAILLGRLRYSVVEARATYMKFGEKIFGDASRASKSAMHWPLTGEEQFKPANFEKILGELVHNDPLMDPHPQPCKVVVLTMEKETLRSPVLMRSYASKEHLLTTGDGTWKHNWTIKEAARATSAAPTYFPSLHVENKRFEDAGLAGYNNPVREGLAEVRHRIPEFKDRHVGCVVSLGTGLGNILTPRSEETNPDPSGWGLASYVWHPIDNTGLIKERAEQLSSYLVKIATDTDRAHREMINDPELSAVYFRADIPGLGEINLADISQGNFLQSETRKWLDADGKATIDACVKRMKSQTIPSFELRPAVIGKPTCLGRADVIEDLSVSVSSAVVSGKSEFTPRSVLIRGTLGVGKSTVALQIMNDARVKAAYKNRICYIRCDGTFDIAALKSKLLAMRKIDGGKATDDDIRQLLSAAPTLVCLDNFEYMWDSQNKIRDAIEQELLPLLASSASLIVTVRGIPNIRLNVAGGWSSRTVLQTLDAPVSRHAFLHYSEKPEPADTAERIALDSLVKGCDGLPLSISLVGCMAINRDFTAIVAMLAKEKNDAVAKAFDNDEQTRGLGVSIRLSLSEDRVRTTPSALALCCVLAMLPDGASPDFLESGYIDAEDVISEAKVTLIERGLAYVEPAYGLLRMLSPLRVFFKHLKPDAQAAYGLDMPKLYGSVRRFHFDLAKKSLVDCVDNKTRRLLFAQARNIEAAVMHDIANPPAEASAFAAVVDAACGVSGWYVWAGVPHAAPYLLDALAHAKRREYLVLISQLMLEIGRDLADEDGQQTKAIETLTEAYNVSKKYADELMAKGDDMIAEEKRIFQELYKRAADASKERAQLELASATGDLKRAEAWIQDAIAVYDNFWDEEGRMDAIIVLAGIQAQRLEVEAARSSYETVLKVAKAHNDRNRQAIIYRALSKLVSAAEDKRQMLEQSATLFDELDKLGAAAECRLEIEKLETAA